MIRPSGQTSKKNSVDRQSENGGYVDALGCMSFDVPHAALEEAVRHNISAAIGHKGVGPGYPDENRPEAAAYLAPIVLQASPNGAAARE